MAEEVLLELGSDRLVILEGPVGSGKSRLLSTVAARSNYGAVRRIFPDPSEKSHRYAALAHLITSSARAHIDLIELANEHGSLLIVVDDFQHLDEGSARLLLWGIQNAPITLVVSCASMDSIPLLAEAKFENHVRHLELPLLDFAQIKNLLEELWNRSVKTWEVVAVTRFAGANMAAVRTFAGFVDENFPHERGPNAWHRHIQDVGKFSHTTLYAHVRSLKENHEPEIFDALQILAVVGPCSLAQALQWIPSARLQEMDVRGLISQESPKSPIQLANGLLDLSLRLSMETDLARTIYESRVSPVFPKNTMSPPPEHIFWWQSLGIEIPRELVLAGARSALLAAQPASALLLLENDSSHEAAWLAAEAHVLTGNSSGVISNLEAALSDSLAPEQLGAREALVCLAAGYWPKYAGRFVHVNGLEAAAKGVYLSSIREYEKCIALAVSLDRGVDEQMWQNVQAFAALGEVMAGNSRAALERIARVGVVATEASSITAHNVAETKQAVQFLAGEWNGLRAANLGEYGLHALLDRSGLSTDIGRLLGEPSGATADPINYDAPAPFGYAQIRELARIVVERPTADALVDLQSYNQRYAREFPKGLRLLGLGWELKLRLENGNQPETTFLKELETLAQSCDGTIAQLISMLSVGIREKSGNKLEAAISLAQRQGLGSWIPPNLKAQISTSTPLSPRELEIANWAADGSSSVDIAMELDLSVRTVEKHLENTYKKLEISGRDELTSILGSQVGAR
ncbi:LuxR C-terminal-related transcriptional regulator [Arthrobacter sp. MYb227]|uniref:LuxR C-terminal-related transcriptional regulator n=1 Tax=Arthrobacter sp. MYb227 TaxID=1848601 RepID=UPI0015E3D95F|nr:LuxR C-terminal-related transcriptional regulator [Arthrobacter sp. MYb227]